VSTIHEEPFSLPYYCGVHDFPSVASVARKYDSLRGIIFQHNNANPHTAHWTRVAADVSLGSSGPSTPTVLIAEATFGMLLIPQ